MKDSTWTGKGKHGMMVCKLRLPSRKVTGTKPFCKIGLCMLDLARTSGGPVSIPKKSCHLRLAVQCQAPPEDDRTRPQGSMSPVDRKRPRRRLGSFRSWPPTQTQVAALQPALPAKAPLHVLEVQLRLLPSDPRRFLSAARVGRTGD